jgi:hypothetical protein
VSFFAVLDSAPAGDVNATSFAVEEFHINLWCMDALGFRRRKFVVDVGIRIKADTKPVTSISLALPFGTDSVEDLQEKVLTRETASLIFDTDVVSTGNDEITIADQPLKIMGLKRDFKKQDTYSSGEFSVWDLPLISAIQPGKTAYVRVRFPILNTGRVWQWQRRHLVSTGATLDLRISDQRSTQMVTGGHELASRIRPLGKVAAFVMVPSWLHGRTVNPAPSYIRLLEANVWKSYLGRKPEWRRRNRLVVYYWKNERKADPSSLGSMIPVPVTKDDPMRVFGDFIAGPSPSRIPTIIATSLLVAVALGAAFVLPVQPWLINLGQFLTHIFIEYLNLIIGTGVVGLLAWAISTIKTIREWLRRGKVMLLKVETRFYKE